MLLDAENISSSYLDFVIDKASKYGALLIRRAYADWSMPQVKSYRNGLKKHAFFAVHQFSGYSGKNSSDMAMSIDAMDLAYKSKPDVMVLATSDSDFTPLVVKLREMGVQVIGIGNPNVAKSLVGACNDFHYIPILSKQNPPPEFVPVGGSIVKPKPTTTVPVSAPTSKGHKDPNKNDNIIAVLNELIDTKADAQGRVNSAVIGLAFNANNINISDYGFDKVTAMVGHLNDFEIVVDNSTHYIQRRHATPATEEAQTIIEPKTLDSALIDAIAEAIFANQDEFGWAKVGKVAIVVRQQSGIHSTEYGYETLSDAIIDLDMFELHQGEKGDHVRDVRVTPPKWMDKKPAEIEVLPQYQNTIQVTPIDAKHTPQDAHLDVPVVVNPPLESHILEDKPKPQSTLLDGVASESLPPPQKEPSSQTAPAHPQHNKAKQPLTNKQINQLRNTIHKIMADNPEHLQWISLSNIGVGLRKGGIEPKQFGVKNFSALIDKMGCFETKTLNTVLCLKNPFFVQDVAPTKSPVATDKANVDDHPQDTPVDEDKLIADKVTADVVPDDASKIAVETAEISTTDASQVQEYVLDAQDDNKDFQIQADEADNKDSHTQASKTDSLEHEASADDHTDEVSPDVLAVINDAIIAHQDGDGYAKVGDIGKYVRDAIGLGAMSFGYADFGKMLSPLPQYEVTRMGRFVVVRLKAKP